MATTLTNEEYAALWARLRGAEAEVHRLRVELTFTRENNAHLRSVIRRRDRAERPAA